MVCKRNQNSIHIYAFSFFLISQRISLVNPFKTKHDIVQQYYFLALLGYGTDITFILTFDLQKFEKDCNFHTHSLFIYLNLNQQEKGNSIVKMTDMLTSKCAVNNRKESKLCNRKAINIYNDWLFCSTFKTPSYQGVMLAKMHKQRSLRINQMEKWC